MRLDSHELNSLSKTLKENEKIDAELKRLNENRLRFSEFKKEKNAELAAKNKRRNSEQY